MLMPHLAIGPTGFDKAQMQPTVALAALCEGTVGSRPSATFLSRLARTAAGGCLLEAITCNMGRLTYA
jgi:hypothetical protein